MITCHSKRQASPCATDIFGATVDAKVTEFLRAVFGFYCKRNDAQLLRSAEGRRKA